LRYKINSNIFLYVHPIPIHILHPQSTPEAGGGYFVWSSAGYRGAGEWEDTDSVGAYCEYTFADGCKSE